MIEEIKSGATLIALIIRDDFKTKGVHFFTPGDFSQQLGYMHHPANKKIKPHFHNPVRRLVHYTQEVLFIKRGTLRADFYDDKQRYLESRLLFAGDVLFMSSGGHGFEVLDEIEMIEVKQGPYIGESDITRFESVSPDDITLIGKTGG